MRNRFITILALCFLIVAGANGQAPDYLEDRDNPTGHTGALKAQIQTGGSYDAYSGNGTRVVTDLRVPDALGVYGLNFTRYWNSNQNDYDDSGAELPLDFGQSGWSHSWSWSAVRNYEYPDEIPGTNTHNNIYKTTITITFPDGHATKYKIARLGPGGGWLVPPSYPVIGPPFTLEEIQSEWPYGGIGVQDRICNMTPDGNEFWLCRADGGSVHFVWVSPPGVIRGNYRATEVFDPHGLKTTLTYTGGRLERVEQDGGRYLFITWNAFPDVGSLITRVHTGGGGGGSQQVKYYYKIQAGYYHVLTFVGYENDPAPGQTAGAVYIYGWCYGDETQGCALSEFPLLKRADDPRYAGAMTKIRYNYAGTGCQPFPPNEPAWVHAEWIGAQPYRIAAERSDSGHFVSSFQLNCNDGLREETNGLGGTRKFYFGRSAGTGGGTNIRCRGFQLGKVTDFYSASESPDGAPNHRQNFFFGEPRHIWDGLNNQTTSFSLDGSGSPTEIVYSDNSNSTYDRVNRGDSSLPNGNGMHNIYDRWLFSKKDERGHVTTYTRDSRRRVTRIAYYNGAAQGSPVATESYTYNDMNQVTTHTLPSGAVRIYHYNTLHQLEHEENSVNEEQKRYTYDGLGRVETIRDTQAILENAPYTERMEYNGRHNITKIHYRATGGSGDPTATYEYDKYGNRTAIIDELGHRKDFTYDSYRRCTSTTEQVGPSPGCNNAQVRRWDWIYDRVIEDAAGNPGPSIPASFHTSKEWRIQIEPEFNDAHDRRATSRTFDVNNRMLSERSGLIQKNNRTLGDLEEDSGAGTNRVTYDRNGQKETSTDPHNRVTTYEYNQRNRLEKIKEPKRLDQQNYPETRFLYDLAGNKTMVTFPDNRTQKWDDYDPFGQAWKFTDERQLETHFVYQWGPMKKLDTVRTFRQMDDNAGTEIQVTDFDYDEMGRPTWTYFPDGSSELNGYERGRLSAFKTRKNQTKRLHYDARGREDYHTWDGGVAPRIDRIWDDANRLTKIWNSASVIDYQYDGAGQVRTEGTTITGTALQEVRYCRYPNGDVSQITYPNGSTVVNRFYTPRGQLKSVGWGVGSTSYAYLPDGQVDYQARSSPNNVTTSYGYDGRGILAWLRHTKGGDDLARRDYWRDDRDRIKGWKKGNHTWANPMENGRGDRYDYDEEGQLFRASYQLPDPENNPTGALRADEFHYDELGNRVRWNNVASRGAMDFKRRDNKLNQYESWENNYQPPSQWGSAIYYDSNWGSPPAPTPPPPASGNGVTMADGWIVAGYNALNQPVAMWSPAYPGGPPESAQWLRFEYDPLGRCVKRWIALGTGTPVTAATYYYYDGWNLIQEGNSTNSAARLYVHGGRVDEIVASWGNGQWYNHHYDARGHCVMLTSANGSILEQYDYDAFGMPYVYRADGTPVPLKFGSPAGNRFLFTGREWVKDMRVYDYRARMYNPELGRFLQPDPTGFDAGDYNLYRYCHNDPVNRTDPTGLQDDKPTLVNLTHTGHGDWDFDNGRVAEEMQRLQAASITMAQVSQREAEKAQNQAVRQGDGYGASPVEAGLQREGDAKRIARGDTEGKSEIGQSTINPKQYYANPAHDGNKKVENFKDSVKRDNAPVATSAIDPSHLPSNYKLVGAVLGMRLFSATRAAEDIQRAKNKGWQTLIITAPGRKVPVIYDKTTNPNPTF